MKLGTYWLPLTVFPGTVGYVPSAEAWAKVMKHLKCSEPYPSPVGGNVTTLEKTSGTGALTILVTFNPGVFDLSLPGIAGIVAHEVTHIAEFLFGYAGETKPGSETVAYMHQHYTVELMHAVLQEKEKRSKIP